MQTLTLKVTGNDLYDRIAGLVGNEAGKVTGAFTTDGKQYFNANFPNYGEVTWIPEECCTITEAPDPESASA
jgi:hypothetical protein